MIVIDANIMASALMGTSLPLLVETASRVPVVAPIAQFAETRRVLERREQPEVDQRMAELAAIVEPLEADAFDHCEQRARERLHARGQSDWPVLAAALALEADIWSRDPDFFGTGVAIWSTRNVKFVSSKET